MPINPDAVGAKGEPSRNSWTSTDALLHALCGGDPARFKSMDARFSKPVMPGDQLTISMWVDGNSDLFRTANQDGDVEIDQGKFGFV